MSDENKIVESAKRIRKKFRSEVVVEKDSDEMSFLDELDHHVKNILGDDASDIYTVLDKEKLEKWKSSRKGLKARTMRFLKGVFSRQGFYVSLLIAITMFLVSEAVDFYSVGGEVTLKSFVKAVLTEISFIFLAGYRASGKIQTIFVSILRTCLFCLMLFVISSSVITHGTNTRSEIKNIAAQIQIIEGQIDEKQKEIDYYKSIEWPRNATQSRLEKEKLVEKLLTLKERQIKEKKNEDVSDLVLYKTYGRAFFRVILLMISALLTRRLFSF